jgi:hypothetical protein
VVAIDAKALLKFPLKLLGDFDRWLWRSGTWGLRTPLGEIAYHVANFLPPTDGEKLRAQLSQFFFQSWYSGGRINPIFHYALDPKNLLYDELYKNALFHVEMMIDGKKQRANAIFYSGRLFSIELPKPIKFYKGKTVQLGTVTRGNPRSTMTRAIDRKEHGRNAEYAVGAETQNNGK